MTNEGFLTLQVDILTSQRKLWVLEIYTKVILFSLFVRLCFDVWF